MSQKEGDLKEQEEDLSEQEEDLSEQTRRVLIRLRAIQPSSEPPTALQEVASQTKKLIEDNLPSALGEAVSAGRSLLRRPSLEEARTVAEVEKALGESAQRAERAQLEAEQARLDARLTELEIRQRQVDLVQQKRGEVLAHLERLKEIGVDEVGLRVACDLVLSTIISELEESESRRLAELRRLGRLGPGEGDPGPG